MPDLRLAYLGPKARAGAIIMIEAKRANCAALLVRIQRPANGTDAHRVVNVPCGEDAEFMVTSHRTGREAQACGRHVGLVARTIDQPAEQGKAKEAQHG